MRSQSQQSMQGSQSKVKVKRLNSNRSSRSVISSREFSTDHILRLIKNKQFDPKIIINNYKKQPLLNQSKKIILKSERDKSQRSLHSTFREAKRSNEPKRSQQLQGQGGDFTQDAVGSYGTSPMPSERVSLIKINKKKFQQFIESKQQEDMIKPFSPVNQSFAYQSGASKYWSNNEYGYR